MKNGSTHGPAAASSTPISAHVQHGDQDDAVADLEGPIAAVRADGLADQRGAGHRDAHRRHVAKGGQHHDDLRRGAVDGAEAHLHQLKQRKSEDVRGDQQSHREIPISTGASSARPCKPRR